MMMQSKEQGFTLIEMMITMGIALFIMAGMTSVFVSQTRTATMLKNRTEAMGDLFLASQIMQAELRSAKAICWDSTKKILVYQPVDSNISIFPCGLAAPENGSFQYEPNTATDWHIMWKRYKAPKTATEKARKGTRRDELIQGLPISGGVKFTPIVKKPPAPPLPKLYEVTITSQFRGQDNQMLLLPLTFKVWARNR